MTSATTTLLCILIPVLRVLINVFPFTPNRWFGLGFALYYVLCTPLLYKVGTASRKEQAFGNMQPTSHRCLACMACCFSFCCSVMAGLALQGTGCTIRTEPCCTLQATSWRALRGWWLWMLAGELLWVTNLAALLSCLGRSLRSYTGRTHAHYHSRRWACVCLHGHAACA